MLCVVVVVEGQEMRVLNTVTLGVYVVNVLAQYDDAPHFISNLNVPLFSFGLNSIELC